MNFSCSNRSQSKVCEVHWCTLISYHIHEYSTHIYTHNHKSLYRQWAHSLQRPHPGIPIKTANWSDTPKSFQKPSITGQNKLFVCTTTRRQNVAKQTCWSTLKEKITRWDQIYEPHIQDRKKGRLAKSESYDDEEHGARGKSWAVY